MTNIAHIEEFNGKASFFSRREKNPYCHLGVTVDESITSKEDVMKLAKLDNWNVRHVDLESLLPASMSTNTNYRMVVRDNPYFETDEDPKTNLLGMVKSRHEIVSNEEVFDFAERLLVGGRYETAGSLNGGSRMFLTMALDAQVTIDEHGVNDEIKTYLVLANSHDGTSGLTAFVSPLRIICQNTLDIALKEAKQKFTIRHTKSLTDRMRIAEQTLNLAINYEAAFKEDAETLLAQPVTDNEFFKIMSEVFPLEEDATTTQAKNYIRTMDNLDAIWNSGTIEGVKNSKWGVLNTATEYLQYGRKVIAGNEQNFWEYGTGLSDAASKERSKIHDLVAAW